MIAVIKKVFNHNTMTKALEQFGAISIENFLLFSLIGILIALMIVLLRRLFKKETELSDILSMVLLAVYVSVVFQLTLLCRSDNSRIGVELDLFHGLMGPENDFHWLMIAYVILNCMMFIPFGFIISLFSFVNTRKLHVQFVLVLLISLVFSLLIEIMQLITGRGYYEVQDLASNTLGGVIGWFVFAIVFQIGKKIAKRIGEK